MRPTGFPQVKKTHIALVLFCLALPMQPQAAPDRPDAGQIFRENAPPLPPLPEPGENRLQVPREKEQPVPMTDGPTVLVQGFAFAGNEHIASDELLRGIPAITRASGGQIDLAGLNALAGQVTRYYREQGYAVATAYVPAQKAGDGIVTITVLEGKFDRIELTGTSDRAGYSGERLKNYLTENLCNNASPDCQDMVLERRNIDRTLGIVSDLPGLADIAGSLRAGGNVGTSIFELAANAGPSWTAQLSTDNYGNRHTGRARGNAGMILNNPLGMGDRLSLDYTTAGEGLNRGGFAYNLPVGYSGWRLGLDYTPSVYVLGAPFDAVDAHGQAHALTFHGTYPLIRGNDHNLFVRAGYSYKWLEDDLLDSSVKKKEWTLPLGVNGNVIDRLAGGGLTGYGLTFTGGRLTFEDAPQTGGEDTAGTFRKLNYNLSRDQALFSFGGSRLSLYGSLVGQWAWDNLDSVEKFSLGGPDGVRAYPVGEAPGDIGATAIVELRSTIPLAIPLLGKSDLTLALFRDQGWLTVNETTWAGYSGPEHRQLGGTGAALSLLRRDIYALKLMWAFRDHGGEAATSDEDEDSRVWVQASVNF